LPKRKQLKLKQKDRELKRLDLLPKPKLKLKLKPLLLSPNKRLRKLLRRLLLKKRLQRRKHTKKKLQRWHNLRISTDKLKLMMTENCGELKSLNFKWNCSMVKSLLRKEKQHLPRKRDS